MTPSELKREYYSYNPDGHFFDPATMKAFGDTMSNFIVTSVVIDDTGYWVLSRKKAIAKSFREAGAGYWFRKTDLKVFTEKPSLDFRMTSR